MIKGNIKQDIDDAFDDALEFNHDLIDVNPFTTHVKVTPEQITKFAGKNADVAILGLLSPQFDKIKEVINNDLKQMMEETNQEEYNAEVSDKDMMKIINIMLDNK